MHRVDEPGELLLGGEEIDLHSLVHRHHLDGFFAAKIMVRAIRIFPRLVRFDFQRRRRIAVVDFEIASLGNRPDAPVAVGRLHREDFEFAL